MTTSCQLWIVHENPDDFPGLYVARKWVYQAHSCAYTEMTLKSPNVNILRQCLRARDLKRIKNPGDEHHRASTIFEYWTDAYKFGNAFNSETNEFYEYE